MVTHEEIHTERQTRRDTLLNIKEYTRNDTPSYREEYTRRDKHGRDTLGETEGQNGGMYTEFHTPSERRHIRKDTLGRTHTEVDEEINESIGSERHT